MYFKSVLEIKENWPIYRCNPSYWVFSENISEDFTYCVQNTQTNMMGSLLQPINYMMSSLTGVGSQLNENINNIRGVFGNTRSFFADNIESIFGVFLNMIIQFQKMIISIKDLVGKMVGIIVTIMYVLDGSIKTMKSAWAGPPGKVIKSIGSCFHPDTKIKLKNGEIYKMQDLPLGSELEDGAKVFSVLKIANFDKEPLYKIKEGVDGEDIYVTGKHFIKETREWIQVKECNFAEIQEDVKADWFSCLITTNRQIKIGEHIFWDWEDDELTKN
jgi:hypothetical protein